MKTTLLLFLAVAVSKGAFALEGVRKVEYRQLGPLRGRWILTEDNQTVPPDSFRRGLQTSGLFYDRGLLWAVGDQRSQYPGHLFLIDPATARLVGKPIRMEAPEKHDNPLMEKYRALPNSDLEGLTRHPHDRNTLFAVTEDKHQWIIELRVESAGGVPIGTSGSLRRQAAGSKVRVRIVQITPLRFSEALRPFRDDTNSRLEGLTTLADEDSLILSYERLHDELPRLFRLGINEARSGRPVAPTPLAMDFAAVERRSNKSRARLNLNGLVSRRHANRSLCIALARDQERVLVLDCNIGHVLRSVDLDFRSPDGQAMLWVSPEAVALDRESGRLWIINDPDSIRGNYRLLKDGKALGKFADYTPLLFEVDIEGVLGGLP